MKLFCTTSLSPSRQFVCKLVKCRPVSPTQASSSPIPTLTNDSTPKSKRVQTFSEWTKTLPIYPESGYLRLCYHFLVLCLECHPSARDGLPHLGQFLLLIVQKTRTTEQILSHAYMLLIKYRLELGEVFPEVDGRSVFLAALIQAHHSRHEDVRREIDSAYWSQVSGLTAEQIKKEVTAFHGVLDRGTNVPNLFKSLQVHLDVKRTKGYQYNPAWRPSVMQTRKGPRSNYSDTSALSISS